MARRGGNPRISITADADGVGRATRSAEGHLERLDKSGSKSLGRLKSAATGMAVAVGVGAAIGLKKSVDAAIEAEKTQARLEAQLKASNISYKEHAKQIDAVIEKHSKLSGLDDEDLTDAFTNIVRVTGDVDKSLRLTGLAADFARAKHMDVAKAGELVGKVAGGNTGILGRYGIKIKEGSSATEALGVLQQKFAGQAEAYGKTTAGAQDRVTVASENLGEVIGTRLTPLLAKGANALLNLVDKAGKLGGPIRTVTGVVGDFARRIQRAFSGGNEDATKFAGNVRKIVSRVIDFFQDLGRTIGRVFKGSGDDFRIIGRAFLKLQRVATEIVLAITKRTLPILKSAIEGIATVVRGVVKIVAGILSGDFKKAWDGVKTIVRGTLRGVGGIIKGAWAILGEAVTALARYLIRQIGKGLSGLGNVVKDKIVDGITFGIDQAGKVIPGIGLSKKLIEKIAGDAGAGIVGSLPGGALGRTNIGSGFGLQSEARSGLSFIRSRFGGVALTSGRRSAAENAAAGGAKNSDHLTGLAVDLVPSEGWTAAGTARLDRIAAWARNSPLIRWIGWRGVAGHGPGDHLHLSFVDRVKGDILPALGLAGRHPKERVRGLGGGSVGDVLGDFMATSYGPPWDAMNGTGTTATGVDLTNGPRRYGIAVDPSVIPLNSRVKVWPNPFGYRGEFVAFDTGGAIKGNHIDFYDWRGRRSQLGWGSRTVSITTGGSTTSTRRRGTRSAGGRSAFGFSQSQARARSRSAAGDARANRRAMRGGLSGGTVGAGGIALVPGAMRTEDAPTELDYVDAAIAKAALTGGTEDDLVALQAQRAVYQRQYDAALKTADPRDDIAAAQGLKGAIDAIEALTGEMEAARRMQEQRDAINAEILENQKRIIALAGQGPQIIAAVIAAANGGIGESSSGSLYRRSAPGEMARY